MTAWFETLRTLLLEAGIDPTDEAVAKAGYEQHLKDVRAEVPAGRLVEWTTGDGWEPLCAALGMAVPQEPFPHVNTTEEFRAQFDERVASGSHEQGDDSALTADPSP